jgi:hypothetical protein
MMNQLYSFEIACDLESDREWCRIWSLLRAPDLGIASGCRCRRLNMGGSVASYSDEEGGVVAVIRAGTS